jgi:Na+/melibiose symporter-like transporter
MSRPGHFAQVKERDVVAQSRRGRTSKMTGNDVETRIVGTPFYDDSQEDTLWSMFFDFYNRKMLPIVVVAWAFFLVVAVVAVFAAMRFFASDQVKHLIAYATLFVICCLCFCLIKIFAWQMIHRNGLKRQIKRLELRVAELARALPQS